MEIEAVPGVHEMVISLMQRKKRGNVLDIAAGYGNISSKLNKLGFEVIAADLFPEKFNILNIKCLKVDANKSFPIDDESFDYAVSVETIEHLENPWKFIREIHRILKPRGTFLLTTPNVESWVSRLFFLFFGQFKLFIGDVPEGGHITPIFSWTLKAMIGDKFRIKKIYYNNTDVIPILPRIGIWIRPGNKNKFFGEIHVIELEKI